MDQKITYRLSDKARQKRLRQFTKAADPEDLRAELGAARLLAQECLDSGQTALAARLLETIGKCATSHVAAKKMRGELIERTLMFQTAKKLLDLLTAAIDRQGLAEEVRFQVVEEVAAGIDGVFSEIEQKRIVDERAK